MSSEQAMKGAFNADPAAKADAQARIAARVANGTLANDLMRHGPGEASWAGELAQASDAMRLPATVGIPAGIGLLADRVLVGMARWPEERHAVAQALVAAIAPGADLVPLAAAMVLAMLDAPELADHLPHDLAEPLRHLHRRVLAGETVPRAEWSALRQAANAAGDQGFLIETAAWPMAASRAGVIETFNAAGNLLGGAALHATGWNDADEAQVRAVFDSISSDHAAQRAAGETIDYRAIFAARQPELAARQAAAYGAMSDAMAHWARKVAVQLEAALATAGQR